MENPESRPFYGEYAWAYDLIIVRPAPRRCAFVAELLVQRGVTSGARILDAGCGTGRYTLELARSGYIVTGLDVSPQLIEEAQRRASHMSLPVSFAVGDILSLPAAPLYDGILCRGVLNDLVEERSRHEVFFAFARALRPGGVLVFDVREWHATASRKIREPIFETSVDTARGQLIFRSVTQLDHSQRRLLAAEQHTLKKDGEEVSAAYDFVMRCWTQEELHHHLTQAGFHAIIYFGDYDWTVPPGATDRLVSVASLP
jgi:2-polyprenyl-3-methyl-5-hydroxy-6-metoxy-1,4-benzoquinol methylase